VKSGIQPCAQGRERLALQTAGWQFWQWKGHKCHYISAGEDNTGPIVVLVHGFGAHSYHWRYTVPALARQGFRVYALCMLGYG
jgi:alpha-beta hydrolase superfamily lysophospholipase